MTDDNGTPTRFFALADGSLPWLQTSGNTIVTEDGQEVILRGANVMRAEFDNNMVWENKAIPELAKNWHGNVLTRGFASEPVIKADDPTDPKHLEYLTYRNNLDELVSLAKTNSMYLILAWRSFVRDGDQPPMPDAAAQQALAILAARYKNQSHVIYALQVEPHDVDWATLRPLFETMVDAIRSAAAPFEPLVMIPGTKWSRDLSGAITDPVNRPNVVYKTHPYNAWSEFQGLFGDAFSNGLPVFVGEFAQDNMTMNDIRVLLELTRKCHIGWAAWLLDGEDTFKLMKSATDLSPTDPYGTTVQAEMLKPPSAPGETVIIDDSIQGTDPHQWQYQGTGWQHCTDCDEPPVTYYNASQSWTDTMNDTAELTFFGRQLGFFGVSAPWHGIAAVSIDGGPETMIDLYAVTKAGNVLLWTSPLLAPGIHTFTLRATGDKNPASTGTVIALDRVEITVWV